MALRVTRDMSLQRASKETITSTRARTVPARHASYMMNVIALMNDANRHIVSTSAGEIAAFSLARVTGTRASNVRPHDYYLGYCWLAGCGREARGSGVQPGGVQGRRPGGGSGGKAPRLTRNELKIFHEQISSRNEA